MAVHIVGVIRFNTLLRPSVPRDMRPSAHTIVPDSTPARHARHARRRQERHQLQKIGQTQEEYTQLITIHAQNET